MRMCCEIRAEGCGNHGVHHCAFYDEVEDLTYLVWICRDCCARGRE
jgi:hypothetical protein